MPDENTVITKDTIMYCVDNCGSWERYKRNCPIANGITAFHCCASSIGDNKDDSYSYETHCLGVGDVRTCAVRATAQFKPPTNIDIETSWLTTKRQLEDSKVVQHSINDNNNNDAYYDEDIEPFEDEESEDEF